ncbi:MAG: hypothetical protein E7013_02230 [Alphaproteobacteria bacterium]|nr:hypothetical protein [Alphaproteobacteria bacterium]
MSNKFKSMLAAGTILAGTVLAPSANAAEQKDTRNGWERFVHGTTEIVDKGTHYLTEAALYPVRLVGTAVDAVGYGAEKGLDWVGDNVPGVKPVTDLVGDGIRTATGLGASALDITTNLTQKAVKYPIHLTGSVVDATATATRDVDEAGRRLTKEAGILTSKFVSNTMLATNAMANTTIDLTKDLLRSGVKSAGDLTAQTVGVFDKEAGANVQQNVDAVDGATRLLNTGDTLLRGFVSAAPGLAVKAAPLLNDDIRGDMVDKVKTVINEVSNGNPDALSKAMEHNAEEIKEGIQGTIENIANKPPKEIVSTLKTTLAGLSQTMSDIERNQPAPSLPTFNLEGGGREDVKSVVDSSEAYRAKLNQNGGR